MRGGHPQMREALGELLPHHAAVRLCLTPSKHVIHLPKRRPLVGTPVTAHTPVAPSDTALSATRHTALSPGSPSPKRADRLAAVRRPSVTVVGGNFRGRPAASGRAKASGGRIRRKNG